MIMHIGIHACGRWKEKKLKIVSMKTGDMGLTKKILMESFGKVLGSHACMGHMHMGNMVVDRWN